MKRSFEYTHSHGTRFILSSVTSVAEALDLSVYLTLQLQSLSSLDHSHLKERIFSYVEEAHITDELGEITYTELEAEHREEFIESHLSTGSLIYEMIEAILDGSGLPKKIATEVRERFTITFEDSCECPICQPNSNGKFMENTTENIAKFKCLLGSISAEAKRICFYAFLLSEGTDWSNQPYWLFNAYQIMKEVEMTVRGREAKKRKVKRKSEEVKKRQAEINKQRGYTSKSQRIIRRR